MKFAEIKEFRAFCESMYSNPDWRKSLENILDGETDFEVNGVRFIADSIIDEVLADELESDNYILGCFNSWVIADATGWPIALIEAAQKGEAYEEIGEAMTKEHIKRLAEIYAGNDGYGHHFNSWDGSSEEIEVNGEIYHVFDKRG